MNSRKKLHVMYLKISESYITEMDLGLVNPLVGFFEYINEPFCKKFREELSGSQ
jgi:hypothetical protein